jgi:hypothetical protein
VTSPNAATGDFSQPIARSRSSNTSAARAATRASLSSSADSSRLKTPSRLRRGHNRIRAVCMKDSNSDRVKNVCRALKLRRCLLPSQVLSSGDH